MLNTKTKELRAHPRYPMRWPVALVFDETDTRSTLQGAVHDISAEGASILTDINIFSVAPVTVLIAIPPLHAGQRKTIVEVRGRMRYTVHSSAHGRFRIGIHFETFVADGRAVLQRSLKERAMGLSAEMHS